MRNKTFISSMVLSVACVSAANAAVAFDSFTVWSESYSDWNAPGINWASPASSQPIFGASGTRTAYAYQSGEIGGNSIISSVSGGTATFTTTGVGGAKAGLKYAGNAQDITGYTFSFDLNMTGADSYFMVDFWSASDGYAVFFINYAGAGTYTVDLSTVPTFEIGILGFRAVTEIGFEFQADSAGSATMSNFVYTPAPGALALLGVAGLAARRRRA